MPRHLPRACVTALSFVLASSVVSHAAIDTLVAVVDTTSATGGNSMAAFGYNPADDSVFVSGFGAGAALRRITNVSGAQTSMVFVTETELQLFYRDGDPSRGVSSPLQSGIVLNPLPIVTGAGTIPAHSIAVIADNGFTRFPSSTTTDPAATKRFYTYDLQAVVPPGDGRDVFTTLVTLADMQAAIGTTNTSTNQGRQPTWSGDGQSLYFTDSSTAFGGLWKVSAATGAVTRLAADVDLNTEPAVTTAAGVDTIYVRGGGATGNVGGLDKYVYDGTTLGARTPVLTLSEIREFLDADSSQEPTVFAATADAAGNVYFNNSDGSPERRAIFRLDPQGRVSKVVSVAERDIVFTGALGSSPNPNANTLRMQTRLVTHPTAGPITQVLYAETTPVNLVAGANAFEPGDFDRDGGLDTADLSLFANALRPRGVALTSEDDYKFDLNANSVVDWRDVKVLQQFAGFADGDTNLDSVLDLADIDVMSANYYTTSTPNGKRWTEGDLVSIDPLYAASAADANLVNELDVHLLADTWRNVLGQPILRTDLTSRGYDGQFLADVLGAFGFSTTLSAGDFNGDGRVDNGDLDLLLGNWGASAVPPAWVNGYTGPVVDNDELDALLASWGLDSVMAVPESSTLLLALVVIGSGRLPRRRI